MATQPTMHKNTSDSLLMSLFILLNVFLTTELLPTTIVNTTNPIFIRSKSGNKIVRNKFSEISSDKLPRQTCSTIHYSSKCAQTKKSSKQGAFLVLLFDSEHMSYLGCFIKTSCTDSYSLASRPSFVKH